jgi:hypothetical protein
MPDLTWEHCYSLMALQATPNGMRPIIRGRQAGSNPTLCRVGRHLRVTVHQPPHAHCQWLGHRGHRAGTCQWHVTPAAVRPSLSSEWPGRGPAALGSAASGSLRRQRWPPLRPRRGDLGAVPGPGRPHAGSAIYPAPFKLDSELSPSRPRAILPLPCSVDASSASGHVTLLPAGVPVGIQVHVAKEPHTPRLLN